MGARCQICRNSTLLPLDLTEKHYSDCTTLVRNQNHTHSRGNVQKVIKDAPTEEILRQRIAKQECYTELVEIILAAITDLSYAGDLLKEHETHVENINRISKFM